MITILVPNGGKKSESFLTDRNIDNKSMWQKRRCHSHPAAWIASVSSWIFSTRSNGQCAAPPGKMYPKAGSTRQVKKTLPLIQKSSTKQGASRRRCPASFRRNPNRRGSP
jgi:hypothetical protein